MIKSDNVQNILRNVNLIQEIEKLAKQENSYDSLPANKVFKQFIDCLKPFVNDLASPPNNWEEDKPFLQLIEVVNQQIINQLTEGEQKMTGTESAVATKVIATKTAIVMGLGVIGLIGIGLYAYRCSQNKGNEKGGSLLEKAKEVVGEVKAGFDSSTSRQQAPSSQPEPQQKPTTYEPHVLLLVTTANQLDKNLTQDQDRGISTTTAEKIIANAIRAYCFAENDLKGKEVLKAVEYSDESIEYENESRVFLQLSLSAKPEITQKRDRLGIREALNPDEKVKIITLKKLGTARSTTDFYSI